MAIQRRVARCEDRPGPCVLGRFPREVPRVEFLEGGFQVIGIEGVRRRDPSVGIDLPNRQHLGLEWRGTFIVARASASENQALPTGRDHCRRAERALRNTAGKVPQLRRRDAQFVEPRERGIEIILVEQLSAADHLAVDQRKTELSPLGLEPVRRRSVGDVPDDGSAVGQPAHDLDVRPDVLVECPRGAKVGGEVTGCDGHCCPAVVDVDPVGRGRRQLTPPDGGVGLRDDSPRVPTRRRLTRQVPGVEFLERGVEIIGIEQGERREPTVAGDLDDVEDFGEEGVWLLIPGGETGADENE